MRAFSVVATCAAYARARVLTLVAVHDLNVASAAPSSHIRHMQRLWSSCWTHSTVYILNHSGTLHAQVPDDHRLCGPEMAHPYGTT